MNCYGLHYGKLPSCPACEQRDFCKDAGYPKKSHDNVQFIDGLDGANEPEAIERKPKTEIQRIAEILNEANNVIDQVGADVILSIMLVMHRIQQQKPVAFKIALKKILNPSMSYSTISKECGIKSKQLVNYYIKQSILIAPELSLAIIPYSQPSNPKARKSLSAIQTFKCFLMYQPLLFDANQL